MNYRLYQGQSKTNDIYAVFLFRDPPPRVSGSAPESSSLTFIDSIYVAQATIRVMCFVFPASSAAKK